MAMAAAWLDDFRTWVDGLLGDRLSAALAQVRAAVARGTVSQEVAPQVQRCAEVLEQLRTETQGYLARAAPLHADPDVRERSDRLVAIWNELWAQWSDPTCTRKHAGDAKVGLVPAGWAAVVVVVVAGVAYAVSEVGSAWAMATTADAEVALAQVRLQTQELDARIAASADGKSLPPSTLPPPEFSRSGADAGKVVKLVMAGLGLTLGAALTYATLSR
jgi:hypothetical protein